MPRRAAKCTPCPSAPGAPRASAVPHLADRKPLGTKPKSADEAARKEVKVSYVFYRRVESIRRRVAGQGKGREGRKLPLGGTGGREWAGEGAIETPHPLRRAQRMRHPEVQVRQRRELSKEPREPRMAHPPTQLTAPQTFPAHVVFGFRCDCGNSVPLKIPLMSLVIALLQERPYFKISVRFVFLVRGTEPSAQANQLEQSFTDARLRWRPLKFEFRSQKQPTSF